MSDAGTWQLSKNSAERYAQFSRYMLEPWVPALLEAIRLQPGERALDLACGTGFVTRQAARVVGVSGKITGIDINAGMLAEAEASLSSGSSLTIEWLKADVCALPFPDECFDAVLCQQGLQFFPEKVQALREARRVLVEGGRIALSVWGTFEENPYFLVVDDVVRRHISEEAAIGLQKPRSLADPDEVHALLSEAGFKHVQVSKTRTTVFTPPAGEFLLNHLSAMPVADDLEAMSEHTRKALIDDLHTLLKPYEHEDGMHFPGTVYIATASR